MHAEGEFRIVNAFFSIVAIRSIDWSLFWLVFGVRFDPILKRRYHWHFPYCYLASIFEFVEAEQFLVWLSVFCLWLLCRIA